MMKTLITLILLAALCSPLARAVQDTVQVAAITAEANMPRPGDRLEKFEIQHIPVSGCGDSLLWDLSGNEPTSGLTVRYRQARDGQLIEIENNSVKYYRLTGDTLYLTRHSQPGMSVAYPLPEAVLSFPLPYGGSSTEGAFYGEGNLGNVKYMRNAGYSSSVIDARGCLVTPEGDTLSNVVRSHYRRWGTTLIDDTFAGSFSQTGDSALFCPDSIRCWLATDSITHRIDRWRWYARGYRYPVAEAETYKILYYGMPVDSVNRYYYYSAVDQQYDLQDDIANRQIRDLDSYGQGYAPYTGPGGRGPGHGSYRTQNNRSGSDTPNARSTETHGGKGMASIDSPAGTYPYCTVTPTIVTVSATVCYGTAVTDRVDIRLYNAAGALLWEYGDTCLSGDYSTTCPMDNLPAGEYLIVAAIGGETFTYKVIRI